jgi:hypothetical protein
MPFLAVFLVIPAQGQTLETNYSFLRTVTNEKTGTIDLFVSPSTPINAVYVHAYYENTSCTVFTVNEKMFPLLLENTVDNNTITVAIAALGTGFSTTTKLGSLTCTQIPDIELQDNSSVFEANGLGTELPLRFSTF